MLRERRFLAERTVEGIWVGELSTSALSTATAVCALSLVQQRIKQADVQLILTFAEEWEKQEPIMRPAFQSKDAREGALAFAEKRPPVWQGR